MAILRGKSSKIQNLILYALFYLFHPYIYTIWSVFTNPGMTCNILRDHTNTLSFNFPLSLITTWKTHAIVRCEQYSLVGNEILSDSGGNWNFCKGAIFTEDKEQDGGSTNVWLRFLLLMIMHHWMLASETWYRGKL